MLVNRKSNNGSNSMLQVILVQGEVLGKDPALTLKIRDRLIDMGKPSDNIFALVCEGRNDPVLGQYSPDGQKLKDAVNQALIDMRVYLNPKKASDAFVEALLPPGLAKRLSM